MSNREYAKSLIDQVPEGKLLYVVAYLQGVSAPGETPEIPNDETLTAMAEIEEAIASGTAEGFSGSTSDFFKMLAEDEEC